ncbi:membrane-bound lytic murein transglycosylase D [Mariniphaga anaerophila]|uniref:Membrane-bound lytic murein transglycosylase D n=1 Tax=Mariniphaga anaerophila TaxID=1484053 RepID=A0A1M5AIK0_9BACT|nr:lytic transglycosylase domain-containing protein [Mariniphaga anaerophila]SHF29732.1 membrane-bound lytic murein transglycosylase D [Mariniphaga anaerophila]
MGKRLAVVILVLNLVQTITAQNTHREQIEMQPLQTLDAGIIATDSLYKASEDSVYSEEIVDSLLMESSPAPDEDLGDIFSEKMDSLGNSWYIRHLFHLDNSGDNLSEFFPKDLPDSVYIKRLEDIEQVVDLSYNNVVKNFIKLYTEKRRDLVEVMLGLSAYYFPMFEEMLDRQDMPLELKYLPVIESALNPKAMSRVGANGLWQFMYGTGRQMGLEITSFVDERRDPVKSTEAAIKYFKYLYDTYEDWYLAIAAYNCGPGNVNRAIRRSGGKRNYWEIYYRLPRETRGYVPAFIAAAYVMNFYKEHNLQPRMPEIPLRSDTILVRDYLHFNQLEAKLEIDKEQLRSLNPMFRRDVIPAKKDKPYPLVLPNEKIMAFIDLDTMVFSHERDKYFPDNTLQNPTSSNSNYFTPVDVEGKAKVLYTVKSGDNVGFISSWFKVRSSDLKYWNNINRNMIRAGQKLAIYVDENQKAKYEKINTMTFAQKQASVGKSVGTSVKAEPKPLDPDFEYYTVRSGDTIWEIAGKYAGISPDEILKLNNLSDRSKLSIGQKLKIKAKGSI